MHVRTLSEISDGERAALLAAATEHGKAVLCDPVFDTIKLASGDVVSATLDRDALRWPVAWAGNEAPAEPEAGWFEGAFALPRNP